jgi:hypothetical protein
MKLTQDRCPSITVSRLRALGVVTEACVWLARQRSDGQLGLRKAGMPET